MWRFFCLLLLIIGTVQCDQNDDFETFKQGVEEYFKTKTVPNYLLNLTENFNFKHLFRQSSELKIKNSIVCKACNLVMNGLLKEKKLGATKKMMQLMNSELCTLFRVESRKVCYGFVARNADPVWYITDHKKDLDGQRICAALLQNRNCPKGDNFEWEIEIPEGHTVDEKEPSVDSGNFNILHLSDFHYDPMYTPGKNVACEDALCCQSDSDDPKDSSDACGYWTEYKNADIPWHTVEELLKQVKNHDFDFVYFTGDLISHRVWSTSIESNTQAIKEVYQLFRDKFSVPVFPILGNHEPTPMNQFSTDVTDPNISTSWLFNLVAEEWSSWLPKSALETIRDGGYYTVSPRPGFRIIVLNSNVCFTLNWWLIYDDFDPYNQLSWLAKTLLESEQNGESVHILSHVPSGDGSCLQVWSREFNKIVQRFANTITGHFNGHTHMDEFQVFFNQSNPSEAVNVAYNGASLVTWVDSNPSYKVIEVNNETYIINDIVEWTFNLTEANLSPEISPNWYKLYSFKQAYNLADLKPKTVGNLLYTMAKNHTLLEQFNNFRFRNSDNKQTCDQKCQRDVLCVVSVTLYGNNDKCNELQNIFDESL